MGRTGRSRQKRYKYQKVNLSSDCTFINLVQWLRSNEWIPNCHLQPTLYEDFGRGLMTKTQIKTGDVVFSLPYNLLITSDIVEQSPVACVFHCAENLRAQDVLSLFLLWEKLQGSQSVWYSYIQSLPTAFALPLFCSEAELALMPSFVNSAVEKQRKQIIHSFTCITDTLRTLQCCHSCGRKHTDDISLDINICDYLWAWSVVNTRSVYCQKNKDNYYSMKITDSHCMALAPLLDMFNHSNESDLKAELTNEGNYHIIATSPIAKYSQVFIHYGHHSNLHLYLEYGFVIPNNMYDVLEFTVEEVLNTTKNLFPKHFSYSNAKKTFVSSHKLYTDLICYSEGISFNVKGLIYLVTSPEVEKTNFQKKIFSSLYNQDEQIIISVVASKLIQIKILEFTAILDAMNCKSKDGSESFKVATNLVKQYLNMLRKALFSVENSP